MITEQRQQEQSKDDAVDFKYEENAPITPDNLSWKYIMLTSGRWAATEGGCASMLALGIFAVLFIMSCSLVVALFR